MFTVNLVEFVYSVIDLLICIFSQFCFILLHNFNTFIAKYLRNIYILSHTFALTKYLSMDFDNFRFAGFQMWMN
jgi:hypothetical protein